MKENVILDFRYIKLSNKAICIVKVDLRIALLLFLQLSL